METRELFERLVTDEPPLRISPSTAAAVARRAEGRRNAGLAGVLVAVVVVGSGVVVEAERGSGPVNGPAAASASATVSAATIGPAVPTLPFSSAAQISASNDRVYALLVAHAGGASLVTTGQKLWDTSPITDTTQFVGTQLQYRTSFGLGMLRVVTDTAADAKTRYGGLLNGDLCAELSRRPSGSESFVGCAHEALSGGGSVWSFSDRESTPGDESNRSPTSPLGPAVYRRDVIVVANDGSAMDVMFQALTDAGANATPLTDAIAPSLDSLRGIALDAAGAWQPHDADVASQAAGVTSPSSVTGSQAPATLEAMPSLGGPAITSLPFRTPAQITASNAAVYATLLAGAGGKARVIKGWPTWDSDPVSAKTVFLGTQVQWPAGGDSAYLQVVTDTAADARTRYGGRLSAGLCVQATTGPDLTVRTGCQESPLPGGAKAVYWEVQGPLPDATGATGDNSAKGTLERHVLVVAQDESVLSLNEFAIRGHQVGGGTPVGLPSSTPAGAGLVTLAASLAQAWESAAS